MLNKSIACLGRETTVRGVVVSAEEAGCSHTGGHMDSNPDRIDFNIQVTSGDDALFRQWFLTVAGSDIVGYGNSMRFAEIGASRWNIEVGLSIEIGFSEYLEARLEFLTQSAKNFARNA